MGITGEVLLVRWIQIPHPSVTIHTLWFGWSRTQAGKVKMLLLLYPRLVFGVLPLSSEATNVDRAAFLLRRFLLWIDFLPILK